MVTQATQTNLRPPIMEAQDYSATVYDLEQLSEGMQLELDVCDLPTEQADVLRQACESLRKAMNVLQPLAEEDSGEDL